MPSTRSVIPRSAASPAGRFVAGGVASYRVRLMKTADAKNDSALIVNATLRPNTADTMPPTDAPMASIADHIAADNALAGISSSGVVMLGIVAVLAGSKNADAAIVHAITT